MVSVWMLSITGGRINDGTLFRTLFYGTAFAYVYVCVSLCSYMKIHEKNNLQ